MRHSMFRQSTVAAVVLAALATVTGCAHHKPDPMNTVSGTMTHHERVTLSPDAVAYVRLADLSDDMTGGKTVVQTEVHPQADGTVPFFLTFKEKMIRPNHEYAVDVRVVDKGQLMLISDSKQPVLTNGHGNELDVTLRTPGRH